MAAPSFLSPSSPLFRSVRTLDTPLLLNRSARDFPDFSIDRLGRARTNLDLPDMSGLSNDVPLQIEGKDGKQDMGNQMCLQTVDIVRHVQIFFHQWRNDDQRWPPDKPAHADLLVSFPPRFRGHVVQ